MDFLGIEFQTQSIKLGNNEIYSAVIEIYLSQAFDIHINDNYVNMLGVYGQLKAFHIH